jgi:hypothetical protein
MHAVHNNIMMYVTYVSELARRPESAGGEPNGRPHSRALAPAHPADST